MKNMTDDKMIFQRILESENLYEDDLDLPKDDIPRTFYTSVIKQLYDKCSIISLVKGETKWYENSTNCAFILPESVVRVIMSISAIKKGFVIIDITIVQKQNRVIANPDSHAYQYGFTYQSFTDFAKAVIAMLDDICNAICHHDITYLQSHYPENLDLKKMSLDEVLTWAIYEEE